MGERRDGRLRDDTVGVGHSRDRVVHRDTEVALLHGGSGQGGKQNWIEDAAEALVISEDKDLVLYDGAAQRGSELILLERGLHSIHGFDKAGGVEIGVAQKFPKFAVQLIGAALDGGVDDCASGAPVLGAVVIGLHLELCQGIGIRLDHLVGKALIAGAIRVVIDTVEQKVIQLAALAVDVERSVSIAVTLIFKGRLGHARDQQCEIGIGSAVERKVHNLFGVDHLAAAAVVGFQ